MFSKLFIFFSIFFLSAICSEDYLTGDVRDISIMGIVKRRLIITYKGSGKLMGYYLNSKDELKQYNDHNDSDKNILYGLKECKYAEFQVPNSEEIIKISPFKKINPQEVQISIMSEIVFFKIKNDGKIEILNENIYGRRRDL